MTGGSGLLGSNLVRELLQEGWAVRTMARSKAKAEKQLQGLDVELVEGDMTFVEGFIEALRGSEVVFHTAAYFRESFHGGSHWQKLYDANVKGTKDLLHAAHQAGVRKFVQTSSIAVLYGPKGATIDETMSRPETERDDYYRSKILADKEVTGFLASHPEMFAVFVLPGWMHGPGDSGPTSAGQTTLDFLHGKLPGVPPGTVSFVDARDVAKALVQSARVGTRGERYLAAGRSMDMAAVFRELEAVSRIKAPQRKIPLALLYVVASLQELRSRLTNAPALLSLATVRLLVQEEGRSTFSDQRFRETLGLQFRPVSETLRDEIDWYRTNGWVKT